MLTKLKKLIKRDKVDTAKYFNPQNTFDELTFVHRMTVDLCLTFTEAEILILLMASTVPLTAGDVSAHISHTTKKHIHRKLSELVSRGLVAKTDGSIAAYRITTRGINSIRSVYRSR